MDWKLEIERTITTTEVLTSKSYPGMSAAEAKAWEENRTDEEKIEAFHESLDFTPSSNIEITQKIKIFPVV